MNTQGHLRTTQGHIRNTQGYLRTAQGHLMNTQGHLRTTQDHLRTTGHLRTAHWPQDHTGHPRNAQDHLRTTGHLRTRQCHPRTTQGHPRTTQVHLRTTQVTSEPPQGHPRTTQVTSGQHRSPQDNTGHLRTTQSHLNEELEGSPEEENVYSTIRFTNYRAKQTSATASESVTADNTLWTRRVCVEAFKRYIYYYFSLPSFLPSFTHHFKLSK